MASAPLSQEEEELLLQALLILIDDAEKAMARATAAGQAMTQAGQEKEAIERAAREESARKDLEAAGEELEAKWKTVAIELQRVLGEYGPETHARFSNALAARMSKLKPAP